MAVADINPEVMAMVERELTAAPDASTSGLFEKAQQVDPGMKELSVRQFHARYPLQVKRRRSLAAGGGRRKKRSSRKGSGRRGRAKAAPSSALHGVLLEFAHAVSAANDQGPTAMIEFVTQLDEWAAKVEKARD